MRQGRVYLRNIPVGVISETDDGEYRFQYDTEYAADSNNEPVSLTLPLREEPFYSKVLFPCFFSLLSEGENRRAQADFLRIDPEDDFGIMLATATTDTIGAITIKPMQQ